MTDSYGGTPSAASYYERLGVDPDAGDDEINRAGKLAKRTVHPDNNSSEQTAAEHEFDRVTDAADTLTDSDSRAAYDTFIDDQGPETGTARYEEWDAAGRPKSPTAWLSEPRSSGSSSTTASTASTSTTETGNRSTASTTESTTASTTSDNNTTPRARANQYVNNRRRPGEETQRSAATRESDKRADSDNRTTASTADTAETTTSEAASTTPTGRPNTKRSPERVLGEDPEELYSKYVLDSEAAWGTGGNETGGSTRDTHTPGTSTSTAAAVIGRVAPTGVADGVDRFVAVRKPWWLRVAVAVVLLAIAVVVGPIAEGLALLPFVFFPRIGPWLYPTLAVAVTVAPRMVPLGTSALLLAVYAGLAVGYALLSRRRRLAG